MLNVTELTRDAWVDDLSPDAYRDIFEELRRGHSLRQFVDLLHSAYSIAYWSKVDRNEASFTRAACSELRRAVGLPELPATVDEVIATTDPNAAVYLVGEGRPTRVILVATDQALRLNLNGSLAVKVLQKADVTMVTRRQRRVSVSVQESLWRSLNTLRVARNLSWSQLLENLVARLDEPLEQIVEE